MATFQKITPNLWFNNQAEEAAMFYTSVFKNSAIGKTARYGKEGREIHKMPEGTVMTIEFTLEGQQFLALNGGPLFRFNEAISFVIRCNGQEEVDYFWEKLLQGEQAEEQMCGWLKDQFGLSWQVIPANLTDFILHPDKQKAGKAMQALMQMKKIEVKELEKAVMQ